MDWTAFAAAAGGSAVGLAGIVTGYLNGGAQRRHERLLARQQRLYEDVRDAYAGVVEYLFVLQREIGRAKDRFLAGEKTDRFDVTNSDSVVARATVIGTDEMIAQLEAVRDAAFVFYNVRDAALAANPDEVSRPVEAVQRAYREYIAAQEQVEQLIRRELRR